MASVWAKTEAGRQEIQSRSKVASRLRRTLLLLIDGRHGDAELLAAVQGTTPEDFEALEALGLIARSADAPSPGGAAGEAPSWTIPGPSAAGDGEDEAASAAPRDEAVVAARHRGEASLTQAQVADVVFAQALADLIERDLGLWGFSFTLAVERASSTEELQELAERVISAIVDRRGEAQGEAARQLLYGSGSGDA